VIRRAVAQLTRRLPCVLACLQRAAAGPSPHSDDGMQSGDGDGAAATSGTGSADRSAQDNGQSPSPLPLPDTPAARQPSAGGVAGMQGRADQPTPAAVDMSGFSEVFSGEEGSISGEDEPPTTQHAANAATYDDASTDDEDGYSQLDDASVVSGVPGAYPF